MRRHGQTLSGLGVLARSLVSASLLSVILVLELGSEVSAQSGYRQIGANQVVVDRASH